MDKLTSLGADGWEIDHITAVPLTTGWISPRGDTAAHFDDLAGMRSNGELTVFLSIHP